MEQKEIEEFLIRFGGAMTGVLEDAAMEGYFRAHPEARGQFPYGQLLPNLCPTDDLIVGGLAIPPWVIGALLEEDGKKKGDVKATELGKSLKMFGEGDVIYSASMVLHHTLIRNIANTFPLESRVVAGSRTPSGGGQRTDVGHRIIKL
jgi:hypothetical protein